MEGNNAGHFETPDAAVLRQQVVLGKTAGGGVDANRQAEAFGFSIDWVEVRIAG